MYLFDYNYVCSMTEHTLHLPCINGLKGLLFHSAMLVVASSALEVCLAIVKHGTCNEEKGPLLLLQTPSHLLSGVPVPATDPVAILIMDQNGIKWSLLDPNGPIMEQKQNGHLWIKTD